MHFGRGHAECPLHPALDQERRPVHSWTLLRMQGKEDRVPAALGTPSPRHPADAKYRPEGCASVDQSAPIAEYESRLIRWISYFGCAQIVHSDTVWASSSASCRAASASVARPRADRTSLSLDSEVARSGGTGRAARQPAPGISSAPS
jgi:hypothetical protein